MQFVGWYVHWSLTNFEFAFKFKFCLPLQFHEYLRFNSSEVIRLSFEGFDEKTHATNKQDFFSSVKKRENLEFRVRESV